MCPAPIVDASVERHELPLADSFTISRGSATTVTNHVVTLTDERGRVGVGGAAPSSYYEETPESVERTLPRLCTLVADRNPFAQQEIAGQLAERAPGQAAARAAVSIAVHDLAARQRGEPLYRQWGLDPNETPETSYTVSIDTPEEMAAKAATLASTYGRLKVKLGTDADRERLRAIREAAPEADIRVDVNGDWNVDRALDMLELLGDHDIELLEQPVPADDIEGLQRVSRTSSVPVAADESCVTATDVPQVADAVDAVVVKLMKCGGIRPAYSQIATAHAHGLDVMLGCMVESSASIAGSCHLAPLVEYVDLDGALLLAADPWEGVDLTGGSLSISAISCGTGVERSADC